MSVRHNYSMMLKGESIFTSDIFPENVLIIRTVRSKIASGEILSIKIPEIPEDCFIISHRDIPGKNQITFFGKSLPVLAVKKISYIGEPILLICGNKPSVLKEIENRINIEYREFPPVFTIQEAIDTGRIIDSLTLSRGDTEGAFLNPHKIIDGDYSTGTEEYLDFETHAAVVIPDKETFTCYSSSLFPYNVRDNVAEVLNQPRKNIRVIVTDMSSPFGGKLVAPALLTSHAAIAAYLLKRPVKATYTHSEDIHFSPKRNPSLFKFRTVVSEQGAIMGLKAHIYMDAGAFNTISSLTLKRVLYSLIGNYHIPNYELHGYVVSTNNVPSGYYSGLGEVEGFFSSEMFLSKVSMAMNFDPYTWKKANLLIQKADLSAREAQFLKPSTIVLDRVIQASDFLRKFHAFEAVSKSGEGLTNLHTPLKGIGLALCCHGNGLLEPENEDGYTLQVKMDKDNRLRIFTSIVDMGCSTSCYFSEIASKILDIPASNVIIKQVDTTSVPDTGPTMCSRSIMVAGRLLEQSCQKIKSRLKTGKRPMEVTRKFRVPKPKNPLQPSNSVTPYMGLSWEATCVEIELDPVTFQIICRGIWIIIDSGFIVLPKIAKIHVERSALEGLRFASIKNMDFNNGKPEYLLAHENLIPGSKDLPPIHVAFIQDPYKEPGQARGLGDQPVTGVAPAFLSAVSQATRINFSQIPIYPEVIQDFLEKK
ncbi:MAG: xanthine dehydrogenase family protein [Spirochaetales bacterium]|nr:xanthine dehydrogenase family protein [Spirochaetales bacterium]